MDRRRLVAIAGLVVIGLAVTILPLVAELSDYILTLLVSLLVFISLSESWNLMAGYAGQVNLGLAAYFGIGSLCYMFVYIAGAPWYVALLVGGLAGTVLSCVIGPPTLRLRGAYFGIGTMALAEVARLVSTNLFELPLWSPPSYWATFTALKAYYIALAVAAATLVVAYVVVHSRLGMVLQAIRDDEDAANASGINPAKYKMIVFMISSFLAGLAGGALSYYRGNVNVPGMFAFDWTIGSIVSVTIGGWGTLLGLILGSTIWVGLRELFGVTLPTLYLVVTGFVFILVIVFLPDGLVSLPAVIRRGKSTPRRKSKLIAALFGTGEKR
jgi:branched-chain amino acid transport system permease protein